MNFVFVVVVVVVVVAIVGGVIVDIGDSVTIILWMMMIMFVGRRISMIIGIHRSF